MDYKTWIVEQLDRLESAGKTRSGLARYLGKHRSLVTKMLTSNRPFRVDEIQDICRYLGVQPPGLSLRAPEAGAPVIVSFQGQIGGAMWHESQPKIERRELPASNPMFPARDQVAWEVYGRVPSLGLQTGDVAICVPFSTYRHEPLANDLVIVKRERTGLEQLTMARVSAQGKLLPMFEGSTDVAGVPVALVIELRLSVA